jgi:hypothetical protein
MVEGSPKDKNGVRLPYCYDNEIPSGCGSDQKCTLPGPRHGHSARQLYIQGTLVYSIFGGESTHLMGNETVTNSKLTNDMHIAFFEGTTAADKEKKHITCLGVCEGSATWVNTWTTCDSNPLGRIGPVCPDERRDAAIEVMENDPANNGRLLIFGGMGTDTTAEGKYSFGMKDYLDQKKNKNLKAFNDLWYV